MKLFSFYLSVLLLLCCGQREGRAGRTLLGNAEKATPSGVAAPKDSTLKSYMSVNEFSTPVDASTKVNIFVVNNTGKDYYFGDYGIWVEHFRNGKWDKSELLNGKRNHPDVLTLNNLKLISPGDTAVFAFNPFWTDVYSYPPGRYRAVKIFSYGNEHWDRKDITTRSFDEYVFAEFKVIE